MIAQNCGIRDLTGLEYFIDLETLYLRNNQISDPSPLTSLESLMILVLDNNQISQVDALVSTVLEHLLGLVLYHNPLSQDALEIDIPLIQSRGTNVKY